MKVTSYVSNSSPEKAQLSCNGVKPCHVRLWTDVQKDLKVETSDEVSVLSWGLDAKEDQNLHAEQRGHKSLFRASYSSDPVQAHLHSYLTIITCFLSCRPPHFPYYFHLAHSCLSVHLFCHFSLSAFFTRRVNSARGTDKNAIRGLCPQSFT